MRDTLKGIRILDFTDSVAGPLTTLLLAGLGAEVIRVESRFHLLFRRVGPWGFSGYDPIPQGPESTIDFSKVQLEDLLSPVFSQFNYNKKSITLNLSRPGAMELMRKLVQKSDVVVDNLRFGIMENWGLGYSALKEMKEDIIVASMQAMGKGPYQGWTTWAMNLMAYTGFANSWGHPETPMTERPSSRYYGDYASGAETASAIMAALYHRAATGKGQYIEVSQAEVAISLLGPLYLDYFVNNRIEPPRGNRHPQFAPYNCYRCLGEDSWCVIAVFNEEEWQRFCKALEYTAWTRDEKFKDMESRLKNVEELDRNIERWTSQYTPYQIMKTLQWHGVSAGVVQTNEDLYRDIQLRARGAMVEQDLLRVGNVTFSGVPLHFTDGQPAPSQRAPILGEHNDYVYRELLGLRRDEIKELEAAQVIY
jgi:crotonobetainyl-CoA:carnitine CoA-transferase CaiB-like acyl-CoA transferase